MESRCTWHDIVNCLMNGNCTNGSKIPFTPKVADFSKPFFFKLLIGSQPITEGISLIDFKLLTLYGPNSFFIVFRDMT